MHNLKAVNRQWLEQVNAKLRSLGVPANDRAEQAVRIWRQENLSELLAAGHDDIAARNDFTEAQIDEIRSFFLTQSSRDRGYIQPPFVGVYYYMGDFWEATVPFIMGSVGIDPFRYLDMPDKLKMRIQRNPETLVEYLSFYVDCIDYGYAIDPVESLCRTTVSIELFRSADTHLRASGSLLIQKKANSKAKEDARMATEIFLKAFLAIRENLDETDLRQIGHKLEPAIDRCISHGVNDLTQIRKNVVEMPDVASRYTGQEHTFGELWSAYRVAHMVGTIVLRSLTSRDTRPAFFPKRRP